MWELDYKESWAPKNWCFWTVVLEKTLDSPLDCKEIQPVHPKGDQSWVFIGRTDVEAETPVLWPPDAKNWLIWKDPDAGKDWGQEEKGMTEDKMVGWHHQLNGHGFGWIPGVGDGQGGLCWWWTGRHAAVHGVAKSRTLLSDWTDGTEAMIFTFLMLSFKPAFHSHLSPSLRGSLVPLCYLSLGWYLLHIWGYWYFSWESWFQLEIHPAWHLHHVFCIYVK